MSCPSDFESRPCMSQDKLFTGKSCLGAYERSCRSLALDFADEAPITDLNWRLNGLQKPGEARRASSGRRFSWQQLQLFTTKLLPSFVPGGVQSGLAEGLGLPPLLELCRFQLVKLRHWRRLRQFGWCIEPLSPPTPQYGGWSRGQGTRFRICFTDS